MIKYNINYINQIGGKQLDYLYYRILNNFIQNKSKTLEIINSFENGLNYLNQGYSLLEINFNNGTYNIKVIKNEIILFIKVLVNEKVNEKNKVSNLTQNEINKLKDEAITVKEDFNKVIKLKFDIVFIYLKKAPLFKVFHAKSLNNELSSL